MLKYGILARAIKLMCFRPALRRLAQLHPELPLGAYKRRVKAEYKAMLRRTPDIGGSSLESNLYIAAFVFSLHKAAPEIITPPVVDTMVDAVFDSAFMRKAHQNKKCTLFTDKVQNQKVRESRASQTSPYELDWKFDYQKGTDEFFNTYTACGICKLGLREDCFAFVPCLCKMDERSYRNEGGQLYRTQTLAGGDPCCDFHVVKLDRVHHGAAS